MPQITVYGEIIRTIAQDLGIRVENANQLREFWRTHAIDTKLDWFDQGAPVMSIGRQEDLALARLGARASMTLETQDRSNGKRGTRTIDFRIAPS